MIGARKKEKSSIDSGNSTHSPTPPSPSPQEEDPPRSPVPSEMSSASATGSSISSNPTSARPPHRVSFSGPDQDVNGIPCQETAYAKTEVLQGGCLPGDSLPIRIEIHHTKPVKSMQGVIITLFRQGRIDTQPPMPLGPARRGEKPRYEDYYPKSRTGLGGLSLSAAGSSRSFRQDLNQIFAPIIIDPQSLIQVINTSIQTPFDLFPSVSCVPGAMISFDYFVEIVVDLRGKVGSQDRILDNLSVTGMPQHGYGDPRVSKYEGVEGVSYLSTPSFNYLITDQLRRTKGVIFTRTKVIVGTRDSARRRGKQRPGFSNSNSSRSLTFPIELGRELESLESTVEGGVRHSYVQLVESDGVNSPGVYQPDSTPIPEVEENLDEKTRLSRAERKILPSVPPQDGEPSSAPMSTAPAAIDQEDPIQRYMLSAPAYDGPARRPTEAMNDGQPSDNRIPLSPGAQDDKQEFERLRLLALASSPNNDNARDVDVPDSSAPTPHNSQPSAPVLYQDDIFDINDPRIPQVPMDRSGDTDDAHDSHTDQDNPHEHNERYEPRSSHDFSGHTEDLPVYIR